MAGYKDHKGSAGQCEGHEHNMASAPLKRQEEQAKLYGEVSVALPKGSAWLWIAQGCVIKIVIIIVIVIITIITVIGIVPVILIVIVIACMDGWMGRLHSDCPSAHAVTYAPFNSRTNTMARRVPTLVTKKNFSDWP